MAIRKKSETIHLRVSPISKILLESLSNRSRKTSTQILEDQLAELAEKTILNGEIDIYLDEQAFNQGIVDVKSLVTTFLHPSELIITKLRFYYVAGDFLSSRDRTITHTILTCPEIFKGKIKIFKSVERYIFDEFIDDIPDVDLAKINEQMSSLESFAAFKEKNPKLKTTYKMFLDMTGGEL